MSLPSRDEPYDPDMSVHEALQQGLVAVIHTGAIGSGNYTPCKAEGPTWAKDAFVCTRMAGHAGVHAFVARWSETATQEEEWIRRA